MNNLTVYETCNLGSHSPQTIGGQMERSFGKWSSSGFVLVDSPQSVKNSSKNASVMGSISDYLVALSKGWDVKSFLKSLSKVLKALKLGPNSTEYQKEATSGPCMVSNGRIGPFILELVMDVQSRCNGVLLVTTVPSVRSPIGMAR